MGDLYGVPGPVDWIDLSLSATVYCGGEVNCSREPFPDIRPIFGSRTGSTVFPICSLDFPWLNDVGLFGLRDPYIDTDQTDGKVDCNLQISPKGR
eukprot:COSAG02_NODE_18991_length_906_cov_1.444857_1_plen_95_part_00